jgi:hypothetical protein
MPNTANPQYIDDAAMNIGSIAPVGRLGVPEVALILWLASPIIIYNW